ncbi:peroxiredoxin [Emticicia sp. 21SJ11W-3]|uniref:peroxiredoxin family protein n=1 Tax=Emticicia sp. 21SJ11W-3 TaxID=2916755 RepID=UPI00209F21B8|nr:TlpA disulfide reductase family protein [Emticicia sp. 21SJ11W-3]UTA68284.1 TlpA family protein disulfide reductase [Emticicia sp. 21SJ11W-3]
MKKVLLLALVALASCQKTAEVKTGTWRAVILTAGGDLPFGLDIRKEGEAYNVLVINGDEKLKMDQSFLRDDSLHIPMEIFDSEIVAKVEGDKMTGYWKKMRSDFTFVFGRFSAEYGKNYRFSETSDAPQAVLADKYSVLFLSADKKDSTQSVGVFQTKGSQVQGSFLTTTGDYRYLAGDIVGDSLKLSCFDGTHAFLFKAKIDGDNLTGGFWSGVSGYESWTATKDSSATLPDVTKLTYLKEGYKTVDFKFPNTDNKPISLSDEAYKGKVLVIQIMGSWCPNCMDESRFLAPWYKKNKDRGVEIIGLAYEKSTDTTFAFPKIKRMKERFGIDYQVLLAGTNNKDEASKTLPMLNRVIGFPTTIVIDKKGQVRKIHTGFSGPGTGKYYDAFVSDFNRLIDKLLAEKS